MYRELILLILHAPEVGPVLHVALAEDWCGATGIGGRGEAERRGCLAPKVGKPWKNASKSINNYKHPSKTPWNSGFFMDLGISQCFSCGWIQWGYDEYTVGARQISNLIVVDCHGFPQHQWSFHQVLVATRYHVISPQQNPTTRCLQFSFDTCLHCFFNTMKP